MERRPRYAVLHALDGENLPVGLAIERRGYVFIEAMDECGLPSRIEEEYHVRQRDLSEVIYRPDDDQYFDHVLIELARVCAIGEQDTVDDADWGTISSLLREKVTGPRIAALRGGYARVVSAAVIKAQAYSKPVYRVRDDLPFMIHGGNVTQSGLVEAKIERDQPVTRGRHRVAA